jgi:predicted  nucleic acid-binding Zn-ribbon protein
MKFADLRPVKLNNYNHYVPDIDAPDFLEKMISLREAAARIDSYKSDKERKLSRYKNTLIFIMQSKEFHGDKYGYEHTVYMNANTYAIFFCNRCNKYFYQTPKNHITSGCFDCARIDQAAMKAVPKSEFIRRCKKLHRHNNYDDIVFVSCNHVVENILCTKCGRYFDSFGHAHVRTDRPIGCPYCRRSKAEICAENYLSDNGYKFTAQYTDHTLKLTNSLKIDFMIYVNGEMRAIELNGKQHYKQANRSKEMELNRRNFELYQLRDKAKVVWCAERGIPLLVIPYLDFKRIPELIEAFINDHKNKIEAKRVEI